MKKICVSLLTIVLSVFSYGGFGQNNSSLIPPVTYVEAVVDAPTLQSLAHEFSVDRVDRTEGGLFKTRICLSFKDFDDFLARNIVFSAVQPARASVQMAQNYAQMTANWNRYPTYNTYLAMMDTFQTRYPQLCKIETIMSATPNNHKVLCAHISNNLNDREGKPSILYISTIHGDEVVGYYMLLRLMDYLLTNYSTDSYVTELVDNVDIWICPLLNPDGTYFSSNNQINESPVSVRYNHNWADLNRSFPLAGLPLAKSDYEPEVDAMMQFMASHNFTLAANLHGGAEVFNYPWDSWTSWERSHADADWWEYVGRRFADTCQYFNPNYMNEVYNGITEGGDWYVITGSLQDYHNWYLGTRHVTIEVSDDKVLSSNRLPSYWGYIRSSLLNFIQEARNGIHGVVTDAATGEPLQALVYIANHDLDHSYVESVLPYGDYHRPIKAGQYAVTYSAEGYLPKTIVTNVADGQRLEQNVQLTKSSVVEDYGRSVSVYPNPAKDFITVEMADGIDIANIALYDVNGRSIETTCTSSLQRATLEVKGLPTGVYFLHIRTGDGIEIIRKTVIHP